MRYLCLILFFCTGLFSSAQEVSLFYDESGELTLLDLPFESFETIESGYSNGLQRGVYWLQVEPSNGISYFQLDNNHITNLQAYQDFLDVETSNSNGFTSFRIMPDTPAYIRMDIQKEAYFPFTIKSQREFDDSLVRSVLALGIFYGFALVVLFINLGLFFTSKDYTYLYYSAFLVFILAVFAHRDGLVEILGVSDNVKEITEPFCLMVGGMLCAAFSVKSLKLQKYFPLVSFSFWGVAVMGILLLVLYYVLEDYYFVIGIYFMCLYIFVSSWICSLMLIKVQRFAYIFCLAYFFMLVAAVLFYMGPALDLQLFQVKPAHLKVSALLEMLIITFAIFYRMRTLKRKQKKMRTEMDQYLSEITFLGEELSKNQLGQENMFTKFNLTTREHEVLEMLAEGKTNKQIAEDLYISVNTVKFHVKKIYEKLEVSNRREASQVAQKSRMSEN